MAGPAGPVEKKRRAVRRKLPYPFVPPPAARVRNWGEYHIWCAARYRARDNFGRTWRKYGVSLPDASPEWDPPIPFPPAGRGPRPKVSLKTIQIPTSWDFEANALPKEEQQRYEEALYA
jgi:hypothetical protein